MKLKVLHSRGLVKCLFEYLQTTSEPEAHALICQGIAKMTLYDPSAEEISQANPIDYVLSE